MMEMNSVETPLWDRLSKRRSAKSSDANSVDSDDRALIEKSAIEGVGEFTALVPIDLIRAGQYQPRREFDEEKLQGVIDSIKENGLINPIVLTKVDRGYSLVAGERRVKAYRALGYSEIQAFVRKYDAEQEATIALVSNIQSESLNAIEIARGIHSLLKLGQGATQESVGKRIGMNRSNVSNHLRLLDLPVLVQERLTSGEIGFGIARALIGLPDDRANLLARRAVEDGLSTRIVEEEAGKIKAGVKAANEKGLSEIARKYTGNSVAVSSEFTKDDSDSSDSSKIESIVDLIKKGGANDAKVIESPGGKIKLSAQWEFGSLEELREFALNLPPPGPNTG